MSSPLPCNYLLRAGAAHIFMQPTNNTWLQEPASHQLLRKHPTPLVSHRRVGSARTHVARGLGGRIRGDDARERDLTRAYCDDPWKHPDQTLTIMPGCARMLSAALEDV